MHFLHEAPSDQLTPEFQGDGMCRPPFPFIA